MSKVIESFLVALGFKVDEKSSKESQQAIDQTRDSALKMGAALSAAFVGAGLVAKRTSKDITDVYNTSKLLGNVGVADLDRYRFAFSQVGGSVDDAAAQLSSFESLLANARIGKGPFEELGMAGLPPDLLTDTRTSIELLEKLAGIYPRLTAEQRKLASGALGLNRGGELLVLGGSDQLRDLLDEADRLGTMTDQMAKNAENLTAASGSLARSWQNLVNLFSGEAAVGMSDAFNRLADMLSGLDGVASGLGKAYSDNFAAGSAASAGFSGAAVLRLLGAGSGMLGLTGTASVLAGGSSALALGGAGAGGYFAGSLLNDYAIEPLLQRFTRHQSIGDMAYELIRGEADNRTINMTNSPTININGAGDPRAVSDEVERVINKNASLILQEIRSGVAG